MLELVAGINSLIMKQFLAILSRFLILFCTYLNYLALDKLSNDSTKTSIMRK
jgi:hypothetical protein